MTAPIQPRALGLAALFASVWLGACGSSGGPDPKMVQQQACIDQFDPEQPVPAAGQPSAEYIQAKRLFDGGRWPEAAAALLHVAAGETGDEVGNVEDAQYYLAVTLDRMHQQERARTLFTLIVDDAHHAKRREAGSWLCGSFDGRKAVLADADRQLFPSASVLAARQAKPAVNSTNGSPTGAPTTPGKVSYKEQTIAGELEVVELGDRGWCKQALALDRKVVLRTDCEKGGTSTDASFTMIHVLRLLRDPIPPFDQVVVLQQGMLGNMCAGGPLRFLGLKADGTFSLSDPVDDCMNDAPDYSVRDGGITIHASDGSVSRYEGGTIKFVTPGIGTPVSVSSSVAAANSAASETAAPDETPQCEDEASCKTACSAGRQADCFRLGDMYATGRGARKDTALAASTFKKACDARNADACNALGFLYGRGSGVPRDPKRSWELFQKACDLGHDVGHCANATGASCVARIETAKRRRPNLDKYCGPARSAFQALETVDSEQESGYAGAVEAGDDCFEAMRAVGCTQSNVASKHVAVYCCP